ncbi:MAG: hypothetical protein JW861_10405 [Bacteroidales bacterium]|nr:hypothetical protein [Bacteroidales bacterium]
MVKNAIGIRHEDKYVMERRVALTPSHVRGLTGSGVRVLVQTSSKRIFRDDEFMAAGAEVVENLDEADVIFGVKEIPLPFFREGGTYIFFSHVIKGQSYNMPMLRKMMEMKCTLIDYEKVEDESGKRLIFFGRYAGLAGMINSLWSLGARLREFGLNTPFLKIKQAHHYGSLGEARAVISEVGHEIASGGLPEHLVPLTIGFTGYGNVSNGAQEIAGLLPVKEITPRELVSLKDRRDISSHLVYKVIFTEEDMVVPVAEGSAFDLQEYYMHPERYRGVFPQYIPHLSVLMNCMYWDDRYPRIVTRDYLAELFSGGRPKLTVIGDITCDAEGSVECTHHGTEIEDPVFVYDPFTRKPSMGFSGEGILVMAVDILPSELPRESSIAFSNVLYRYVLPLARADFDAEFGDLEIPPPLKRATILHHGKLTPSFEYLQKYI